MNSRVALFSQYLMRDDAPREEGYRFRGFESGLRRNDGAKKPAYKAFANPLAVERYGASGRAWGLIRPQKGLTRVTIEMRRSGQEDVDEAADDEHDVERRLRPARAPSQQAAVPRALDRAGQPRPRRPADPRVLRIGSGPGAVEAPGGR